MKICLHGLLKGKIGVNWLAFSKSSSSPKAKDLKIDSLSLEIV
jgi:hypothetical protein